MLRHASLLVSCLFVVALVEIAAACGGSSSQSTVASTGGGGDVSSWVQQERLPQSAVPGAGLFASQSCTACHVYAGSGHANLGAPELTAYGRLHRGTAFDIRHLRCPACAVPGSPMPPYKSLGSTRLRQLAVFLEASRGIR